MTWKEVLKHDYIAVTGGPLTGKTTLASSIPTDHSLIHTDEFMELPWSDQPHACIEAVANKPRFIIEGVQVPRALRKGLDVDVVVWLSTPKRARNKRQDSFAKAVQTVYSEWKAKHPHVLEVRL